MIGQIARVVIELAAIFAAVGGVVFFAYFIGVLLRERRERLALLEDHVREQGMRRGMHSPDCPHPIVRAPLSARTRSHSAAEP